MVINTAVSHSTYFTLLFSVIFVYRSDISLSFVFCLFY